MSRSRTCGEVYRCVAGGCDHLGACPNAPFGEHSGAAAVQRARVLCLERITTNLFIVETANAFDHGSGTALCGSIY